ncbi:MAG: patatin-like phospholipase family protein [Pseudomonadota bacterium]
MAKIGLALGGGAARGWAHIGVIRALTAAGIEPDVIAGTSIGAVVGGCYVAHRFDELEEFARSMTPRRMFGYFDFNLAGSGLINGQRLSDALETHLGDDNIEELERPFVAVATEIGTGHEVWLRRGRMVEAIRASYAIPGIFKPVRVNDRWLFDGALVNPIPVSVCRALGAQYVIAVNLNADLLTLGTVISDVGARDSGTADGLASTAQNGSTPAMLLDEPPVANGVENEKAGKRGALHLVQRQFLGWGSRQMGDGAPSLSTIMVDAFNIVHDRIARSRLAGDPPDIIINPKLRNIGLFDFHRAEELVRIGEVAATRALADLREDIEDASRGTDADFSTSPEVEKAAVDSARALKEAPDAP